MADEYRTNQLRNVVLLSHGSAGKTSLVEAMLFNTGAIARMGKVEEGTTVSDYDEEEIRRRISLSLSVIPCEWKGHKINVLDTPGYADFVGEVKEAVRVVEGAIVLLDAASGVEVGTERVWKYADEYNLPRLILINKMDRENANFEHCLEDLDRGFEANFVPLQIPIGKESDFRGVIDLVNYRAYLGEEAKEGDIPAELQDMAEGYRTRLVEAAVESEDELIMKYLEGEELSEEEIKRGLAAGVKSGAIVPVLCGSATQNIGIRPLMDAIVEYLPSPAEVEITAQNLATKEEERLEANELAPLAALAFKTMADPYVGKLTYFRVYGGMLESDSRVFNSTKGAEERIGQLYFACGKEQKPVDRVRAGDIGVVTKLSATSTGDTLCDEGHPLLLSPIEFPKPTFSVAVTPKTKADMDKLSSALSRLVEEDPTLEVSREPSTGETLLSGMGEAHIDAAVRRLKRKFGVEVTTSMPKVPYRETITKVASAQYRHKKQTGGAGQFAEVHLRVEPLARGEGFDYVNEVKYGHISDAFIPSIEKGIKQVLKRGVIAGYPVTDIRAVVYDGKEHPVDSKDIAFQIAGREAFKLAVQKADPVLLEPIMNVTIVVPEEFLGDILGDLNTRRARVQGMEQRGGKGIITAQVPLAEMQRYATSLRSITQGRGSYTMELFRYEKVPDHLAQEIIEAAKREKKG